MIGRTIVPFPIPIRPLSHGEEIFAEVTALLRCPVAAAADDDQLAELVRTRWPAIRESDFEASVAWDAIRQEITRRHKAAQ